MQELMRIDILVCPEHGEAVTGFLGLKLSCGWEEIERPDGSVLFRVHLESPLLAEQFITELKACFPEVEIEQAQVEAKDWTFAWREFFTPVPIRNRFVVAAPWMEEARQADKGGVTALIIDPRMAFGTGHHASTALCLEAVADLAERGGLCPGKRFLDLGTGSGILAIACAKLDMTGVACDIDPLAVENALYNREVNQVDGAVDIRLGSLDSVAGETFDCILANILAGPLMDMAPGIIRCLKPGAHLILSGILTTQAERVEAAFTAHGLPAAGHSRKDEWSALIW